MTEGTALTLRFGTRGSELALWQTREVIGRVQRARPDVACTVTTFTTRGDEALHVPLTSFTGGGVFTGELEAALLGGDIDVAVHSLKDLPTQDTPGLVFGAMPCRADPRDVLVAQSGRTVATLPTGAVVGTCSVRRSAQLLALRPDLTIRPIRGTVEARVRKVLDGEYDATVLAAAGLERLGLLQYVTQYFDPAVLLPAPGQGVLAVQCRADDAETLAILRTIDDPVVRTAATAERARFHALEQKRILVTRPRAQAYAFGAALARFGAIPILCPTIRIEPVPDSTALDAAIRQLERYDWVVFTSVNGVTHFWTRFAALSADSSVFERVRVAAVGPATAAALAQVGVRANLIPVQYVAEQLADAFGDVHGKAFLLPRSAIARETLATMLRTGGGAVNDVPVYHTVQETPDEAAFGALRSGVDVITFASASAVYGFLEMLDATHCSASGTLYLGGSREVSAKKMNRRVMAGALVACIGPVTAAAARDAGFRVDIVADEYTTAGVVEALIRHFHTATEGTIAVASSS